MNKTKWTANDIKKLQLKGHQIIGNLDTKSKLFIPKPQPEGLNHIEFILNKKNISYIKEHKFCITRKFKFDIAIPKYMIAIEYEGLTKQHQGGHQSITGYTANCEKYNIATVNGWHMLRYTNRNYNDFENNLVDFLMNWK